MVTNYQTARTVEWPRPTHSGRAPITRVTASRVDHRGFYPAKADNFSAINQPRKGTNHG